MLVYGGLRLPNTEQESADRARSLWGQYGFASLMPPMCKARYRVGHTGIGLAATTAYCGDSWEEAWWNYESKVRP